MHHFWELYLVRRLPFRMAVASVAFQGAYTTVRHVASTATRRRDFAATRACKRRAAGGNGSARLRLRLEPLPPIIFQVFGAFATLLLLRTGTLAAPVAAHVFCNYHGMPNFQRMLRHDSPMIRVALVGGVLLFCGLMRRFCAHPSLQTT